MESTLALLGFPTRIRNVFARNVHGGSLHQRGGNGRRRSDFIGLQDHGCCREMSRSWEAEKCGLS
jgi:hypothetical protein